MSLDTDLLRTFVAFAETGSLARAAAAVGRSPSAVTAQVQRLEARVGAALLAPAGRGRALTPAGEALLPHARRVLGAHREAWLALRAAGEGGRVGLGVAADFAPGALPVLLRGFARAHPRLRLDLSVGRSATLAADLAAGALDLLLAPRLAPAPDEVRVFAEPMVWLGATAGAAVPRARDDEVPLALLDAPCAFRAAMLHALEGAGRPSRVAATSPDLAGLRAAVVAGLAVTARTARWRGGGVADADPALDLPPLPVAEFALRLRASAPPAAARLAEVLAAGLVPPSDPPASDPPASDPPATALPDPAPIA